MTVLISQDTQAVTAAVGIIEQALGGEFSITIGTPQVGLFDIDALIPEPNAPILAVSLAGAPGGHVAIAAAARLAEVLTAANLELDAVLAEALQASLPVLETVAGVALEAGTPQRVMPDALTGAECSVVQLLEGEVCVATFIVRNPSDDAGVAPHEFQPLDDGTGFSLGNSRALDLLRDVELGVTAELGRRRMVVRDLLALTPGTVIELDRAAGAPIDVLVNGTLIARGEVVVIDEEFGIRITEIVGTVENER